MDDNHWGESRSDYLADPDPSNSDNDSGDDTDTMLEKMSDVVLSQSFDQLALDDHTEPHERITAIPDSVTEYTRKRALLMRETLTPFLATDLVTLIMTYSYMDDVALQLVMNTEYKNVNTEEQIMPSEMDLWLLRQGHLTIVKNRFLQGKQFQHEKRLEKALSMHLIYPESIPDVMDITIHIAKTGPMLFDLVSSMRRSVRANLDKLSVQTVQYYLSPKIHRDYLSHAIRHARENIEEMIKCARKIITERMVRLYPCLDINALWSSHPYEIYRIVTLVGILTEKSDEIIAILEPFFSNNSGYAHDNLITSILSDHLEDPEPITIPVRSMSERIARVHAILDSDLNLHLSLHNTSLFNNLIGTGDERLIRRVMGKCGNRIGCTINQLEMIFRYCRPITKLFLPFYKPDGVDRSEYDVEKPPNVGKNWFHCFLNRPAISNHGIKFSELFDFLGPTLDWVQWDSINRLYTIQMIQAYFRVSVNFIFVRLETGLINKPNIFNWFIKNGLTRHAVSQLRSYNPEFLSSLNRPLFSKLFQLKLVQYTGRFKLSVSELKRLLDLKQNQIAFAAAAAVRSQILMSQVMDALPRMPEIDCNFILSRMDDAALYSFCIKRQLGKYAPIVMSRLVGYYRRKKGL